MTHARLALALALTLWCVGAHAGVTHLWGLVESGDSIGGSAESAVAQVLLTLFAAVVGAVGVLSPGQPLVSRLLALGLVGLAALVWVSPAAAFGIAFIGLPLACVALQFWPKR